MSGWDKISLFKFQQIDLINTKQDMVDIDKTLFSTCVIFDMTEYQLDNIGIRKASILMKKVERIFLENFEAAPKNRIGLYKINYDPFTYTLGQFIELTYYLKGRPIQNAHLVLASVSKRPFMPKHPKRASYFLTQSITKVMGTLNKIIEGYKNFNDKYKSLFGVGTDDGGSIDSDPFNRKYGWMFSARLVAKDLGITLDQAFALPVVDAFDSLAYLKAKAIYDEKQIKRK